MAERRIDDRIACFLRGKIIQDNGVQIADCEVHDISGKGMRLSGADFSRLPNSFILVVERRRIRERVKITRRMGSGVGVMIV
jgi:hypothetical protein